MCRHRKPSNGILEPKFSDFCNIFIKKQLKIEIVMCANIPLEPSEKFPGGQLCLPYNSNQTSRATLYKSMCFHGDRGTRHDPSKLAAEAAGMVGPHGAVRETLVAEPPAAAATIGAEMAPTFLKRGAEMGAERGSRNCRRNWRRNWSRFFS